MFSTFPYRPRGHANKSILYIFLFQDVYFAYTEGRSFNKINMSLLCTFSTFMIDNMWCHLTSTLYKLDTSLDGKLVTFMVSSLELTAYTDLQKHH